MAGDIGTAGAKANGLRCSYAIAVPGGVKAAIRDQIMQRVQNVKRTDNVDRQSARMNGRSLAVLGLRTAIACAAVLGAGGCSTIRDHRGYLVDPALTQSVLPGVDNRLSVERSLGQPTFKSQFGQPAWYYLSLDTEQKPFTRPRIHAGSIMRVGFDSAGNVQDVLRDGVEHAVRIEPDRHQTPALGRERSFFEDLFGNIGTVGALPGAQGGPGGQGGGPPTGTGPNGS
jgi:outer membrane protein assembly factor BamE (lipoprotein component of BamABCDE complex)